MKKETMKDNLKKEEKEVKGKKDDKIERTNK